MESTDISIGSQPSKDYPAIVATPDGTWVFVGNQGDDTVAVIAVASNTVAATIPVGGEPYGLAVTPRPVASDGYLVYVASAAGVLAIASEGASQFTIVRPALPVYGPGIAVTPDGTKVYVATEGFLAVIDAAAHKVAGVVLGVGGSSVAIGPQDRDADGIVDQLDGTWNAATSTFVPASAFSNDFTDQQLGGTSFGTIVSRGGLSLAIWEAANPAGLYVRAAGGAGTAQIKACNKDVFLTAADQVKTLCGSLRLDVVAGPVQVALSNGTRASVPGGGGVTMTDLTGGAVRTENTGAGTITIVDGAGLGDARAVCHDRAVALDHADAGRHPDPRRYPDRADAAELPAPPRPRALAALAEAVAPAPLCL
jgi:YVTN family beta-propeller protein